MNRMIDPAYQRLGALCAAAVLLGCSAPPAAPPEQQQAHALEQADGYYALGRSAYLARRYPDAVAAYRQALALQPGHVDARNGLATALAAQGQLAPALEIWRALTGERGDSAGPESAFLFSNLGYAYLLAGDTGRALATLEKACVLDPLNYRAWENLGETLARVGEDERAQRMFEQAAALRTHDLKSDLATVRAAAPASAGVAEVGWSPAEVRLGGGALDPARVTGSPLEEALRSGAPGLEIRNGNGVRGMAAALGRSLGDAPLRLVRLSNQRGFGVQHTRIDYQPPYRDSARQLAARLQPGTAIQLNACGNCAPVALRLVLGRDLVGARGPLLAAPLPGAAP